MMMHRCTLASAAALWLAIGVNGAGLPTPVAGATPVRHRAIAGAASPEKSLEKRYPASEDGRCGPDYGTRCQDDECCSKEGWCGTGLLYCSGPACQFNYGPSCDANNRPEGPDTEDTPRTHIGSVPYGESIFHCRKKGVVALTFDDGPFEYTRHILDVLAESDAKATFFVTGRNLGKGAINNPEKPWRYLVERMIDEGHQVASHTWSHQRLTELDESALRRQMLYNEVAIADILGYFPTYMRPPYSAGNEQTNAWLGDLGYHVIYYNLDTQGYLHDSPSLIRTSKDIWDEKVEGADADVTQFLQIEHDTVYQVAYNLTAYMVNSLYDNGFRPVTVGECLDDPKKNWYRYPDSDGSRESEAKRSITE